MSVRAFEGSGHADVGAGRRSRCAGVAVAVVAMAPCSRACGGSSPSSAPAATAPATKRPANVVLASVQTTAATKSAHDVDVADPSSGLDGVLGDRATAPSTSRPATRSSRCDLGGALASFLPGDFEMRVGRRRRVHEVPDAIGGLLRRRGRREVGLDRRGDASATAPTPSRISVRATRRKFLAYLETVSDDVTQGRHRDGPRCRDDALPRDARPREGVDSAKSRPRCATRSSSSAATARPPTIPVDVWIDGDGRVRRITLDIDLDGRRRVGAAGSAARCRRSR